MTPLSKEQIDNIASRIVNIMDGKGSIPGIDETPETQDSTNMILNYGIFPDIDYAVKAAREAQLQLMNLTLEKRAEIIANIRKNMLLHAEDLA
ncbi:hypothetical protein KJ656_03660, partial [bacterium]|nr:hypothetical protein [bacterium]